MLSEKTSTILLIAVLGHGFGAVCAALAISKSLTFRKAVRWPSTLGTVTESRVYYSHQKKATVLCLRYQFVVGQAIPSSAAQERGHAHCFRTITGSTPRLSGSWFWSEQQTREFAARYPVGQEVEVFYDPANPKRNCLDREDRRGIRMLWIGGIFVAVVCSLLAWRLAVATP